MTTPATPAAAAASSDLSGREIGDYLLLHRLGRGGMADVYLAEQKSLRRQVACKVLKAELARDESYVRRFHHEAQAAASLVHANIVQIYEVGCVDSIHFIAQEYVAGRNLKAYLARCGPLDTAQAVLILRQAAAALARAARAGLVHRDIKPENIMLAATGEVKVADFGLARVTASGGELELTQIGVTMGTPLYMSPEQAEGRPLDPRSDLYSLGVTAWQMLTGRPLFEGETALAIAMQHQSREPPRLESLRPDLPAELCRIVHRLLAKSPDDRFADAADLLRELRAIPLEADAEIDPPDDWTAGELAELTAHRLEATQQLEAVMRSERRSPRRSLLPLLLGGLLAAGFAAGGLAAWLSRPPSLLADLRGQTPPVDRLATPAEQYLLATFENTEEAWASVWQYFPPEEGPQNAYYARRARQRLAELYLERGELEQAEPLLRQLADLDPSEAQFRAFGMAGLALVADGRGDHAAASGHLARVWPLRRYLPDDLRARIDTLGEQYRNSRS